MRLHNRLNNYLKNYRAAKIFNCKTSELPLRSVFLPDRKIIYICNPKVAGSSIIQSLLTIDHEADDSVKNDHNLPSSRRLISSVRDPSRFIKCLNDKDSFKFTFVRDPYTRILSCFRDKILSGREPRFRKHLGFSETGEVSFIEFLERISKQQTKDMNRHWRPQADLIPEMINLSFIGRFENITSDLQMLTDLLGIESLDIKKVDSHKTKTGNTSELDEREVTLINSIYRQDFSRFGYSKS